MQADVAAVIGIVSVIAPLMPVPVLGAKGMLGSSVYKMAYAVMHWVGQNCDKGCSGDEAARGTKKCLSRASGLALR